MPHAGQVFGVDAAAGLKHMSSFFLFGTHVASTPGAAASTSAKSKGLPATGRKPLRRALTG